jgi:hypothetical protein
LKPEAVAMDQHQAFPGGACVTLCVDFLAHNLGATKNLPGSEQGVRDLQKWGEEIYRLNNYRGEDQSKFLYSWLNLEKKESRHGPQFTPQELVRASFEIGGSQLISFWDTAARPDGRTVGHSVAIIIGVVFVELMDPNLGYVRVEKASFVRMFIEHLDNNYPGMRGKWVIERVATPSPSSH